MFSDKQKPMESFGGQPNRIEKNTIIKGDITSQADFRIDGKLEGNVKTSGKVVIGKDGLIKGKVECVNADIEGNFDGAVDDKTQKEFFEQHIASWAPHFFKDLEKAETAQFYRPVGRIGQLFMEIEKAAFSME